MEIEKNKVINKEAGYHFSNMWKKLLRRTPEEGRRTEGQGKISSVTLKHLLNNETSSESFDTRRNFNSSYNDRKSLDINVECKICMSCLYHILS